MARAWIKRVLGNLGRARSIPNLDGTGRPSRGTGSSFSSAALLDNRAASESLLTEAVELAGLGCWIWDVVEDRCIYCSETLTRQDGMTTDEYVESYGTGSKLLEEIHPDDRERYEQVVAEANEQGKAYDITVREFRPHGEVAFVRVRGRSILDAEGKLVRQIGILQDVTEQKQVEENLRENESRLTEAMRIAKLGHYVWDDLENRLMYCDEEFARIYGVSVEECIASSASIEDDLVWAHPDDRERYRAFMADEAQQCDNPLQIQYRIVRRDGEVRHIQELGRPVFDDKGSLVKTVGIIQDISDQKGTEEALHRSEQRYRELFDESPIAIWEEDWSPVKQMLDDLARSGVTDWRSYFNNHRDRLKKAYQMAITLEISRAAVRLYGEESKEALIEESATANVIDDELDAFCDTVLSFLAGQWSINIESKDNCRGTDLIVRRQVVIPPKYRHNWSRVIYAIEDITERVKVEEQLGQAQKMEALGQLTGGVAHDFNNLLAVILGNAEMLVKRGGCDDSLTGPIIHSARLGSELTQRLLAFSHRQPLDPQVVDLGALTSSMSQLLTRTLGETIEIEITVAAGLWSILADPGQVENVLLNLALNARDAMSGVGKLKIVCTNVTIDENTTLEKLQLTAGNYVVLAVSDQGIGMTAEVQTRAFEPFFTTKEVGEGSGLGLSMIYGFAKQSGGHVTIYSEGDIGTTVKLYMPQIEGAPRFGGVNEEEDVPQGHGETILVIEDNSDVGDLVVRMLEDLSYRPILVPLAAEARKVLAGNRSVDLLLSDVVLAGGTSGPEFAEAVRTTNPDLRIIFMSGYAAEATKHHGLVDSDQVLLTKPFQRRVLAKTVWEALN